MVVIELARRERPQRYLEVGVGAGGHLQAVPAPHKVGIDLRPVEVPGAKVYVGPSDGVFEREDFRREGPFDLVYIDADHEYTQVMRDIRHALGMLSPTGKIVVHDVWPFDRLGLPGLTDKRPPRPGAPWCGDAYKACFHVKYLMPYLGLRIVARWPGWMILWEARPPRDLTPCPWRLPTKPYPFDFLTPEVAHVHMISWPEVEP